MTIWGGTIYVSYCDYLEGTPRINKPQLILLLGLAKGIGNITPFPYCPSKSHVLPFKSPCFLMFSPFSQNVFPVVSPCFPQVSLVFPLSSAVLGAGCPVAATPAPPRHKPPKSSSSPAISQAMGPAKRARKSKGEALEPGDDMTTSTWIQGLNWWDFCTILRIMGFKWDFWGIMRWRRWRQLDGKCLDDLGVI